VCGEVLGFSADFWGKGAAGRCLKIRDPRGFEELDGDEDFEPFVSVLALTMCMASESSTIVLFFVTTGLSFVGP
jgi:hypothetical protein